MAGRGGEGDRQGLVDTIQGLQRALDRSKKEFEAAVSSAKYMQVMLVHMLVCCVWIPSSPHASDSLTSLNEINVRACMSHDAVISSLHHAKT